MSVKQPPPRSKLDMSTGLMNLQDQYLNSITDVRTAKYPLGKIGGIEGRKSEYINRSFSQGGHGNGRMFRYFTLESMLLLVCLTASLLILPVILPPLPPPPLLLLLIPIFILALLMVLALMPSRVRDVAHTYA